MINRKGQKSGYLKPEKKYLMLLLVFLLVSTTWFGILEKSDIVYAGDNGSLDGDYTIYVNYNWHENATGDIVQPGNRVMGVPGKGGNATASIREGIMLTRWYIIDKESTARWKIFVHQGRYAENVKINISIDFEGENRTKTIIDGEFQSEPIHIENADFVNISNFTVKNCYDKEKDIAGIRLINSNHSIIKNCNITANKDGIHFDNSASIIKGNRTGHTYSHHNSVIECNIYNNRGDGIYLNDSNNTIIKSCHIYNNGRSGIYLFSNYNPLNFSFPYFNPPNLHIFDQFNDHNNIISDCHIYNHDDFEDKQIVRFGIINHHEFNTTITHCKIYSNTIGILLKNTTARNHIEFCNIFHNNKGIALENYAQSNIIRRNTILDNSFGISNDKVWTKIPSPIENPILKLMWQLLRFPLYSNNNQIYLNDFKQTGQAYSLSTNCWNLDDFGNYWSDICGEDTNGDGIIGDGIDYGHYNIPPSDNNYDNRPLVYPVNNDWVSPEVTLNYPNGGEHLKDVINISWCAFDRVIEYKENVPFDNDKKDSNNLSIDLFYGTIDFDTEEIKLNPNPIAENLDGNTSYYDWDTTIAPYNITYRTNYIIKIVAWDKDDQGKRNNKNWDISSSPFTINNKNYPYISEVIITDTTIDSTEYLKDYHDVEVRVDITGDDVEQDDILADLSMLTSDNPRRNPDQYNGVTAIWNLDASKVICKPTKNNEIIVNVTAVNNQGKKGESRGTILFDNKSPDIIIHKPKEGRLYLFFDRNGIPFIPGKAIILGSINITVDAHDEQTSIKQVKFCIDNIEIKVICHEPYGFSWTPDSYGNHQIQIIAMDLLGNTKKEVIDIWCPNLFG